MSASKDDITLDTEQPEHQHEHDHEHGEEEHAHEHVPGEGVVATQRGCGDKCAKCLGCRKRTEVGEVD